MGPTPEPTDDDGFFDPFADPSDVGWPAEPDDIHYELDEQPPDDSDYLELSQSWG